MIKNSSIDNGKGFDWGRTSSDYARFRDIYPQEFYDRILDLGICKDGQEVLDIGTGTGVLPRNMYRYGAHFTGADISENQIEQAIKLSALNDMDIDYVVSSSEKLDFPENSFDVVTACQCFMYFNKEILMPNLHRILKPKGKVSTLFMAWLPDEDEIAMASEKLVLKYNPGWTGAGMKRHPASSDCINSSLFETEQAIAYDVKVAWKNTCM